MTAASFLTLMTFVYFGGEETDAKKKKQHNGTQASFLQQERTDVLEDQKKRWEDDLHEFVRMEETGESKGNVLKKQRHMAKSCERPEKMERNRKEFGTCHEA